MVLCFFIYCCSVKFLRSNGLKQWLLGEGQAKRGGGKPLALGVVAVGNCAMIGEDNDKSSKFNAFAISGLNFKCPYTHGVALGWLLIGLSGP